MFFYFFSNKKHGAKNKDTPVTVDSSKMTAYQCFTAESSKPSESNSNEMCKILTM